MKSVFYNKGMDKDDNKLCDKCGLLPQSPVQPKPPVCKRKKKCCKKDCCENEFAFRKVVIPAALGDDETGKAKPENGAYTNSYVEYEANGAQYMYDSYGVYTKIEGGGGEGGVSDFNELTNRPKYAGEEMTGETDIPNVNTAVAAEATLREAADAALSGDIAAETLARQNADSGLQTQIDAISASSDVTDIVGTYAELQNYDTSTLSNNDIVKVLQDEEHDNETTYYRWSTATQTFTLIGEEGPYYTKSAADAKFQDKLTAGANISIDQSTNTISATDTTYNDFTGTDGVNAGTAGLVPAPATTDAGKYLKADGTWDTITIPQSGIPTDAKFWGASYDSAKNTVNGNMEYVYEHTDHSIKRSKFVEYNGFSGSQVSLKIGGQGSTTFGNSSWYMRTGPDLYISGANGQGILLREHNFTVYSSNSSPVNFNNKRIAGVANPINGTDVANKSYVDQIVINYSTISDAGAPTTSTAAQYVGQLYYDTTNDDMYYCSTITPQGTTPETYSYTWNTIGGGGGIPTTATFWGQSYDSVNNRVGGGLTAGSGGGTVTIAGSVTPNSNAILANTNSLLVRGNLFVQALVGGNAIGRFSSTGLGMLSHSITDLADPINAQDAATKNYCDSLAVITFPNSTFDAIIGEI